MERIVVNRSATLRKTFYADGVPADPTGSPTVTVVRSDGTSVTTGAVTDETDAGTWSVTIPATSNTLLDTLTVTWTGVVNGVAQQYVDTVEVTGDTVFTIAEMRALNPQLADPAKYSTQRIVEMRTTVEDAIEEWTGALVPRYHLETLSGSVAAGRSCGLRLSKPYVRAIRSIAIDGTALSAADLTAVTFDGAFLYGYGWPTGYSNIVVGYEHGRDRPPERLRRAALLLAKVWLTAGPVDDRTNTFTSVEGGTFSLVTPGRGGSIFGVPEVDAAVMAQRTPAIA